MIDVYVEGLSIDIGRQGENLARNIYFDLSELINTYGEGTATLVHMRPSDKAPYVCTVTRSDTFLIWAPTSTDTAYAGSGKCELRWVVGDTLAKSVIYTTKIAQSITADATIPSPYQSWYDAIIAYIEANYAANGAPQEVREAIYTLLSKAVYTETGLTDELEAVRAWTAENLSITNNLSHVATNNSATIAGYGTSYTATLTANSGYTLGTVTVTMGGDDVTETVYSDGTITIPSVTGDIVITATAVAALASLSAVYTPTKIIGSGDSLDDLKDGLVVTATYGDSSTAVIPSTDYTLSGTLTEGTSTVTVSYGGTTTTFSVTVDYTPVSYIESSGTQYINTGLTLDFYDEISVTLQDDVSSTVDKVYFGVKDGSSAGNHRVQVGPVKNASQDVYSARWTGNAIGKTNRVVGSVCTLTFTNKTSTSKTLSVYDSTGSLLRSNDTDSDNANNMPNYPLYIFCRDDVGSPAYNSTYKLYEFIVKTSDGTERMHMIPVTKGGTACLFDTISQEYFENDGTGTFAYA
jgi:hypothetical protein